jgi:hypothetical protein
MYYPPTLKAPQVASTRSSGTSLDEAASPARRRWESALAAVNRACIKLARFQAQESALSPEQRTLSVEDDLDERFSDLESARLAALGRLLSLSAPDLPALALKIDLFIDEAAWELADAQACLAALKVDARRLCRGG